MSTTADHDYMHHIRSRQSGTPEPTTQLIGHSIETVQRQTRMRSRYDVLEDVTKYSWQYGKHRYTATYTSHHRGGDDQRLWEKEYGAKAHEFLLREANGD